MALTLTNPGPRGLVLVKPFVVSAAVGPCVRVTCMIPGIGQQQGEIPLEWWLERTGFYERQGSRNAVETCFLALEEWEELTCKVQEN